MKGTIANRVNRVLYSLMALIVLAALAALIALTLGSNRAVAQQDSFNYAVQAVLPDNQIDDQASYFDLKVEPGQTQVLQVIVKNKRDEDIEVAVEANTAFSNCNGVIEFASSEQRDSSMMVDFARIVTTAEPVITVPANGEVTAEFQISIPDEPFEGVVYGGLMFTKLHQDENKGGEAGVSIRNIYRYVIGVRLRESEAEVEPAFELLGAQVASISSPALSLSLRNPQPLIARGMKLYARVYPEGGTEALATFVRESVAMAPNSSMDYLLYFDGHRMPLEPGAYRVRVELQFDDHAWQFQTTLVVD